MRSVYLLVLSLLLGYLAEQQKQLRGEKAVIARALGLARVEAGMTGTMQEILRDLLSTYGAQQALIASLEANSQHVFLGDIRALGGSPAGFHWQETAPSDQLTYLYQSADEALYVERTKHGPGKAVALDGDGAPLKEVSLAFLDGLAQRYQFKSLATVSFLFGREWSGRIFLLDPTLGR